MAANAIAMNMFVQVDADGNRHSLFNEIADYLTDGKEIKKQDAFITAQNSIRRRQEKTYGWVMLVHCKGGSNTWVSLKDMK